MSRFQYRPAKSTSLRLTGAVLLLLLFLLLFNCGVSFLSSGNDRRERETLENALNRGITYCYAVEGRYPESLEYLMDHYGLYYDQTRFFVDYRVSGTNLYPDYTILEKRG